MEADTVFSLASTTAMAGWLVLILAPRRFAPLRALPLWIVPVLLSALYSLLVLRWFSSAEGGYDSLAAVARLMDNDWSLTAAWIHFLAFDLFVGAVIASRMDHFAISRIIQAPILLTIFMFGPMGFLIATLTELGLRLSATRSLRPAASIQKEADHGTLPVT